MWSNSGTVYNKLQQLHDATEGFAESKQTLLEYIARTIPSSLMWGKNVLILYEILEHYHRGVFHDQDFVPHGCVRGPAYSYVRKEEAAIVVKSALEETFGKVFGTSQEMEEFEQTIKNDFVLTLSFLPNKRKLEELQQLITSWAEKELSLKNKGRSTFSPQMIAEGIQEMTELLRDRVKIDDKVIDRLTRFSRLIYKYATEELKKSPKQELFPGNGLLGFDYMRGRS